MILHNKINKQQLKQQLIHEPFRRKTLSFYRYVILEDPVSFRNMLYEKLFALNSFGRIYVAAEGINAQMSVPEDHYLQLREVIDSIEALSGVHFNEAIEDDGRSFYKLTIKVREKIVADGLPAGDYDVTNVGNHLSALEFHELIGQPDTLVVDMRNHYESEIGHFQAAYLPESDTFEEAISKVSKDLAAEKDKKLLLYCTGGIRCEKASAYLRERGFSDVNQLQGGIIEYARQVKQHGLAPKFLGKNFVFDERLGERIGKEIISHCHQCGVPCDTHTNCANDDCHLLFIQCDACREKHEGCCSEECQHVLHLPEEERIKARVPNRTRYSKSKIFNNSLKRRFAASLKG
ncbi:MAG TPA: rhodanese-related sulfurtransferase [Bacteroidales bacterium]|nr:rhodanese-related sulfurtransferase [Bacteroidales bacterium]